MSRKLIPHRITNHSKKLKKHQWVIYVITFALFGGVVLLVSSQAASPTASLQPEQGALSGLVSTIADTNASGGSAVRFGQTPGGVLSFLETFDGAPATPTPWSPTRWSVRRNITDFAKWGIGQSMDAQHGQDCSAPPAVHTIGNWMESGVFICRDHLMTAANADSYGLIMLTPGAQVDFSKQATIAFDVSTLMMSGRDWIDLFVTPIDNYLTLACGGKCPAYNGLPRNGIHIEKDGPNWSIAIMNNFQTIASGGFTEVNQPSATVRTPFEVRLTPNSVSFGTPQDNRFTTVNAQIPFTRGLVQLGHHSYNPFKDNAGVAATWHWDNFRIEPAIGLKIIKSTQERIISSWDKVLNNTVHTVNFAEPAPANSRLVFNAVCKVSIDFGSGYVTMTENPGSIPRGPETGSSYITSIPQGVSSIKVKFSGDDWYAGYPCLFEQPAIYGL